MAKRRTATDVAKAPSKQNLSTEVTKAANAITGVAKNPFADKRKPKPAATASKSKPAKAQNSDPVNVKPSSAAVPAAPAVIIEPPLPVKRAPRPATTKSSAGTGTSGATGVTKSKKPGHAQTSSHQQNTGHVKVGRPEFRYGGDGRGSGR